MARIRTIKPSFWGSGQVANLGHEARLLAVGLISMADDDGRFLCSTAAVNGYVYPNDELPLTKVRKWLNQVTASGLVHEYEVGGVRYGCFPKWHDHQVINRYTPSIHPQPDVECSPRRTKESK